jgi:hypothetical protein
LKPLLQLQTLFFQILTPGVREVAVRQLVLVFLGYGRQLQNKTQLVGLRLLKGDGLWNLLRCKKGIIGF